jgi:hypothetical protein
MALPAFNNPSHTMSIDDQQTFTGRSSLSLIVQSRRNGQEEREDQKLYECAVYHKQSQIATEGK